VHPRTEVPPLLNVPLAEIIDFLVETGQAMVRDENGWLEECVDRISATNVLPRAIIEGNIQAAASHRARAIELVHQRPCDVGHVVEQVLLHEPARVQVLEVKVLELGAETFPQVGLGPLRDPAQVTQRTAGLRGDLRQLVRPEDDKRDHREEKQLGQRKVKHSALRRGRSALITTLNRKGAGVDSLRPGSPFS